MEKKNLRDYVVRNLKNSWKLIPVVGFFEYASVGMNRDKFFLKRVAKLLGHLAWMGAVTSYCTLGSITRDWNPLTQNSELEKFQKEIFYNQELNEWADKNQDGELSKYEQFKIDSLTGILDSSETYSPSFEEVEKAYIKVPHLSPSK